MLVKITTKYASYSLVTFVTHKRFAVLFFLPSCCVSSLLSELTQQDGRGKEDGKPCVKGVTIILLEITFSKHHFLLNRSFCKRPENIDVSQDHGKTSKL